MNQNLQMNHTRLKTVKHLTKKMSNSFTKLSEYLEAMDHLKQHLLKLKMCFQEAC